MKDLIHIQILRKSKRKYKESNKESNIQPGKAVADDDQEGEG